jgi:sarcosine oxidase subunit beta
MSDVKSLSMAPLGSPPWAPPAFGSAEGLPSTAGVLIVGAGVTGLSCAISLAAAGRSVTIVDRAVGAGATSRSGGIIVGDTLVGPAAGFEDCAEELRAWIDRHDPGALMWTGCWELDRSDGLPDRPIDWRDAGVVRVAGTAPGGTLDPSRLLGVLAREASQLGARVIIGPAVTRYQRDGTGVLVETTEGTCRSAQCVLAMDATCATPGTDRWPVRALTVALETQQLPDDVASAIGWHDRRPFYTNQLPLLWGRAAADGGLIAGRELIQPADDDRVTADEVRAAGARLLARIRALHPALAGIEMKRVWAGPIARSRRGVPEVAPDESAPGVLWAGGYGGHGLAQAFRLGAVAARRILAGGC